jgi:hypothetical protein
MLDLVVTHITVLFFKYNNNEGRNNRVLNASASFKMHFISKKGIIHFSGSNNCSQNWTFTQEDKNLLHSKKLYIKKFHRVKLYGTQTKLSS